MKLLKRIVVGHDLSKGGDVALQSSLSLAATANAEIKVVHVIEPHPFYEKLTHPVSTHQIPTQLAQAAGKRLEGTLSASGRFRQQLQYEVCVGKPFVELIVAGRAWEADLLVIGESSEPDGYSLGSTGEHVIRKSRIPVLVTKRPVNLHPKTILVPVDFSAGSKKAAVEALSLAECFRARLVFFHVIDLYAYFASTYGDDVYEMMPAVSEKDLEPEWHSFLGALALENVSWVKRTEEGSPAKTIVKRAEAENADLIVIGTHGRTALNFTFLGSVTAKVARGARCPVLAIRPDAFEFALP